MYGLVDLLTSYYQESLLRIKAPKTVHIPRIGIKKLLKSPKVSPQSKMENKQHIFSLQKYSQRNAQDRFQGPLTYIPGAKNHHITDLPSPT
jgi:hypothetical protein